MTGSEISDHPPELDDDAKMFLDEMFHEKIVPKLVKLGARLGTINCGFAGEEFQYWNIEFKSLGSGFVISDFEYDEESDSIDLDL